MRYTGQGFIKGIPARDLTDAEVKKFWRERLLATGIYIEKRPAKQVKEEAITKKNSAKTVTEKAPKKSREGRHELGDYF